MARDTITMAHVPPHRWASFASLAGNQKMDQKMVLISFHFIWEKLMQNAYNAPPPSRSDPAPPPPGGGGGGAVFTLESGVCGPGYFQNKTRRRGGSRIFI